MIPSQVDPDILCMLRLAFGQAVLAKPIPAPAHTMRGIALALEGQGVPPRVIVQRYSPREQVQAFRAFTAMRALRERLFPVPDVYYFGWSHHTRYVLLLLEFIEGRSIEGEEPHTFFTRVGVDFAQTLAWLHRLSWSPPPDLAMMPLRYAFQDTAQEVRHLDVPHLRAILEWLTGRLSRITELPYSMVHGSYILQNVLAERTRIIVVQNWEQAMLADPRFDVGLTSAVLGSYGITFSEQFLEAYSAVAGPVADCTFWEVLGALRLLARTARSLKTLGQVQRNRFLEQAIPAWRGLLMFVMYRTGLDLF